MAEHTEFVAPLDAAACAQRLQRLTAESRFVVTRKGRPMRLVLAGLALTLRDDGAYAFGLKVRCHHFGYRQRFGGTVFLNVLGRLAPSGAATEVHLNVRSGLPFTRWDWLLQVVWYVMWAALIIGITVQALLTADVRLWELAGVAVLLLALLYGMLALTHVQGVAAVTALIARALAAHTGDSTAATIALDRHHGETGAGEGP